MKHTGTSSITLRRTLMVVLRTCLEHDLNTVSGVYKVNWLLKKKKLSGVNKDWCTANLGLIEEFL